MLATTLLVTLGLFQPPAADGSPVARGVTQLPRVTVDRDNFVITASSVVEIPEGLVIEDADRNGVIQVAADDVIIEFAQGSILRGAASDRPDNLLAGVGIRVDGHQRVAIRGARISGYKAAIHATAADHLQISDVRVDRNFRQLLKSTLLSEDLGDWLWPHQNDDNQWLSSYGAAVYVEDSREVDLREVMVRGSQNGIVLDRVEDSRVYDCDCSFLSGWGLALWRSSRNYISRNAFDFCIRGYSHGVYNRGQDSAGILCFEQSSFNRFYENSATHGGDGFFGFAGKEALGEAPPPAADGEFSYAERGCNNNMLLGNDFSFAAAHGVELTFSFNNTIRGNRLAGNAICGVWGGYSQRTGIIDNTIEDNGQANMREGGGVNIEHGVENVIAANRFGRNTVAVSLWSDDDGALLKTPWALANHKGSDRNQITDNSFTDEPVTLRLRRSPVTIVGRNVFVNSPEQVDADGHSRVETATDAHAQPLAAPVIQPLGVNRPVGARADLDGRESIIMGPWGPWDHVSPMIRLVRGDAGQRVYQLFGDVGAISIDVHEAGASRGDLETQLGDSEPGQPRTLTIRPRAGVSVVPFATRIRANGIDELVRGTLLSTAWSATIFPFTVDPRQDLDGWRKQSIELGVTVACTDLDWMRSLSRGLDGLPLLREVVAGGRSFGRSSYGVIAQTRLALPAGRWRIATLSDDGIRVRVDQTTVIENWTHHGPTRDIGHFDQSADGPVQITVEYFQLDGHAVLEWTIDREGDVPGDLGSSPHPR